MFIVIFITAKLSILSSSSSSLISSSSWWSIRRWLWLWSVISLFVVLINISVLSRCWSHLSLLLLSFLLLSYFVIVIFFVIILFCYCYLFCYYFVLLLLSLMLTSLIHWPWHVPLLLIGNCHPKTSSMWKLQIMTFCAVEVPCNVIYTCNVIYVQLYLFLLKAMSSTKRLLVYTVPVTMVSFALNIPKFFEVRQNKW